MWKCSSQTPTYASRIREVLRFVGKKTVFRVSGAKENTAIG